MSGGVDSKGAQRNLGVDAIVLCVDHGGDTRVYVFIKLVELYMRKGAFYCL